MTGMVRMVDVSNKQDVKRTAVATGKILLSKKSINAIRKGTVRKGDVIGASQLAGIQAAKDTSKMLPFCHQIPLTSIKVDLKISDEGVSVRSTVTANYKTGVEMEALVATMAALLNVWDMVKYLEKDEIGQYPHTRISDVRVVMKKKGES
ncbi:MAG: cyclic pyranopterin monophosphate synthase MoaC [Thermoplasmata archaeon]